MFGELVGASCQNKNFDSGKRRALHSDTPQTRVKGIEEDDVEPDFAYYGGHDPEPAHPSS